MRKTKAAMMNQDERIWELASRFRTEEEIAEQVGLDRTTVNRSLHRTAERLSQDKAIIESMRQAIKARLDRIMIDTYRAWATSQAVPDPKNAKYLDVNLKAMERMCRLLGLDAPQRVESDNVHSVRDVFARAGDEAEIEPKGLEGE